MSKKLSLELSEVELHELVSLIPKDPKKHKKIRNLLSAALIKSLHPTQLLSLISSPAGGGGPDPIMTLIVHTLSVLTGYPESSITPTTKLSNIGMTDAKITQLIGYINQYIQSVGGTNLNPGDITSDNTVQDIYDLIQSKTP